MGILGQEFDLPKIKEYFENQIPNIRVLSDITLSRIDFRRLGTKLKSAFSFSDSLEDKKDIIICYLIYWVYALIYWDEMRGIHDELTDYFAELPQDQIHEHFQLLANAFKDYELQDFGYGADSDEELCSMLMARHAGIPNDEKYQVFELIDDYRKQDVSFERMVEDIYVQFPFKSQYIFSLLDTKSRHEIVWEIRTVMALVSSQMYSREEILKKYPHMSVDLVDYCFSWQEKRVFIER